MKVEKVMFVNARGFKEYAVRYKKGPLSRWEWVKNEKGENAVYNFAGSDAVIAEINAKKIVKQLKKEN
jgi:hypothetical protein